MEQQVTFGLIGNMAIVPKQKMKYVLYKRPVFKEILEDTRRDRYNGILTWALDRLSRNAGDLGSLVDLLTPPSNTYTT